MQNLRGLDPFPAGVLLFTSGVGTVMGTVLAGNLYNRLGPRVLTIVGACITIGTSYWLMNWSTLYSAYNVLPWILLLRGVGLPFVLQSASTSALYGVTGRALPGATTLNAVARQVVAALSIAVLTNVLQTQRVVHQVNLASRTSMSDPAFSALFARLAAHFRELGLPAAQASGAALGQLAGQIVRQSLALSFQDIYLLTTVVSLPMIAIAFLLRLPRAGSSVPPRGGTVSE